MRSLRSLALVLFLSLAGASSATIFGSVRGLIHDPQHRPVGGAEVSISAVSSEWKRTVTSNDLGEFQFDAVPLGIYTVEVAASGFAPQQHKVTVTSQSALQVHFALALATVRQSIEVSGEAEAVNAESSATSSLIGREQIRHSPGADAANSLGMITNFVPSAYVVHDQLHIRGGHQVSWLLDGVPVPNTNIASNVGPQFDPKDIDYLEVQRGGYSAEYGDRTYGVFNVVTRSGFERNREAELVASYGSFHATDDQINFGSHSERFAYYGSVSGNRTDVGLQTPSIAILHDLGSGLSAFTSLIFNRTPSDQLRFVASVRGDHYQVPNTPEQHADGIRDVENERDAFANFTWVHTAGQGILLTVSPFYHFNRAHYIGGSSDIPVVPEDDRSSHYFGGVVTLAVTRGRHNLRAGFQAFGQRDNHFLGLAEAGGPAFREQTQPGGDLEAGFLEEQVKLTNWLTVNGGVRLTRFSGGLTETAADPRVGASLRLPRTNWVLRGFYGRYYQPPPLASVSGPVLQLAASQGFGFLPLRGERDEQHEIGLTIPVAGWSLDLAHFHTGAKNFFDHEVLGNSNIFFPVTIERARIRGWEASLRSPRLAQRVQLHLAFSRQRVQGRGGVSGGLTDFEPPADGGYYYLDHDQRDTLSAGFFANLPGRLWSSGTLLYGSGFLDGDGPQHLPGHTTFDLALGRQFGEHWSAQLSALNISNHRYLLDNSNTFGGTHYSMPRQFAVQVRYRFHY